MHPHVRNCVRTLGVSLEPLFPATSDTELLTYFVARVESAAATGIIEQLLRCDDVEGAYVKPKGVAPERNT
jgi:hypothetical protein